MSQLDNDAQTRVPSHYAVLACALVISTATLAVQLTHVADVSEVTKQGIVTLRVTCTIVWAWYFSAYLAHVIIRHHRAVEERLTALEEARNNQVHGLDPETVASARVIAHRLIRER